MITIQNRKTGETIQIDETNPKLLAKYGIKIPKSVKKMDLGGLSTFMSGIDNSVDTGDPMITEATKAYSPNYSLEDLGINMPQQNDFTQNQPTTSADSPINFPNILSGNNDIQRMGQGIKAIVDGTNNDNPAQAAAGVAKTALAGAMGGSRFFGNINQRKIAFGQENNNTFNQIDGLFAQPYLASNVNKGSNNNPATFEDGGVNKFKSYNMGGMQNVEVEDKETIQTPEGLIQSVYGETHAEGGIPMNLPENSKVFSEKLKHPDMKKSFAKLAKKFETKKDIKHLESPMSDNINKATAELNIQLKNLKSDELFQEQEMMKLDGTFGSKVKKNAMQDYEKKYGGSIQKMAGDKGSNTVKDNNPTLSGTDVAGLEYFGGDLENVFSYAKSLGYNGTKNITDLQRFAVSLDPQGVSNYMEMVKPNNKAISLINERRKKENLPALTPKEISEFSMTMLSPDERKEAFLDEKWDFRYPMIKKQNVSKPLTYLPKEERPSDQITPNNYPTTVAEGDKKGKRSNTLIPRIGNTYPIEPIQKLSLTPYDYTPNLINPQAQINEITRGNYIGNTSGRRSEKAQEWTNDYAAIQNIMGSVANQNTQLKNQASQINNTNRQNINQLNLGYGQTFMDNIAQRNAVVTQQQMMGNNAYTKALTDQNHEASTIEYLKTAYPTEFAAMMANQPVSRLGKAKYGGKIKLKPKKKK